jgi:hypothetical protein
MTDLASKKARFADRLRARLSGEPAKLELRRNLERGYLELLEKTLGEVLPRTALLRLLDPAKKPELYEKAVAKIAAAVEADAYPRVTAHKATVGSYVPDESKKRIDELLAKPNLVKPELVREILRQEAMEELMQDVLFDALKEFNEKVNPFFADWGIPAIVKKVMPIGSGAVLKSLDAVRGEFDKRLDPEMKKFLGVFSKKALDRTANLMIDKGDSPKFVEVRKAIAKWIYTQPVGELTKTIDADAVRLGREAGIGIAARVAASQDLARDVEAAIAAFYAKHEGEKLSVVRAHYGIDYTPDFDALVEGAWPTVVTVVTSATAIDWVTDVVFELLEDPA